MTIALTAVVVVVAIAIILLAANVTIVSAQQQPQQQLTNRPAVAQNGTTLFQNTEDSIRVQVPEGWVIQDVNNTDSISEESTQGYGILAQLCAQEEQQQGAALSNVSSSGNTASCQGSQGDIIHIVRYPDLDTELQVSNNVTTSNNNMTIDNILLYHMQKLQEVGYNGIEIVNSTETTLNLTNAQTNQPIAIVPAKNVEITYSTNSAPNETRRGHFILTATNATLPNLGTTKGYSIFYEGDSAAAAVETIPSGSLAPIPLPAAVKQVFDSFELVTAPPAAVPPPPPPPPAAVPPPPPPPPASATEPLTVEITSSDTEGEVAPATFEFDADVTGGTEPYTYSWDFDGERSEEIDDDETEHTFEEAGTHNVDLTVTDSGGRIGSDDMEITVEEASVEEEQQPPAEEEEEEDNNPGSDDLFGVDDLIDDLF